MLPNLITISKGTIKIILFRQYCCLQFLQSLTMRLYIRLINFPQERYQEMKHLKILHKFGRQEKVCFFFLQLSHAESSDHVIHHICACFSVKQNEVLIKLVLIGKQQQKKVRLVKGFSINQYINIQGQVGICLNNFQIQLQVQHLIPLSNQSSSHTSNNRNFNFNNYQSLPHSISQMYKSSQQLFQALLQDDYEQFSDILSIDKRNNAKLKIILNLYNTTNGYTLLMLCIFKFKNDFLEKMLKDYSQVINMNFKSIDGWLPFQLALAIRNQKAIHILLSFREQGLNMNFRPSKGQLVFCLIDTVDIDLMQSTFKQMPIRYEDVDQVTKLNAYQYVWKHQKLRQNQKRLILWVMHQKHFQFYDDFIENCILHSICKSFVPQLPSSYHLNKSISCSPNLKIASGDILKCRNPPLSSKFVYLSVNSYMGAIEQYEISKIIKPVIDERQKLQQYKINFHLSLQQIEYVKMLTQKQKSWYMKKQWFCFIIKEKRDTKHTFACIHEHIANQWVEEIKQAVSAWDRNQHKNKTHKVSKNYIKISDIDLKIQSIKKHGGTAFIDMFSKRLSLVESSEFFKPTNSTPTLAESQQPILKSKSHCTTKQSMGIDESSIISLQYKDFKMLQLLGEGSFGQVFLVLCLRNQRFYALKTFQKKKIILSKQTKFVIAEVNILKQIRHPFIITLYFTFQTPSYIYLGLQYCQGKDLAKHLIQQIVLPEQDVKIYAAEIVLALEYLHQIGVIYRDLKPENIMLAKDGHVLLVDFGLSKKTENNFAKTFCGSPAYLSPEMLDRQGVGPQTDYFSLGVVIFELIFGQPAFYSQNIHILYENIQTGNLTFPRKIDPITKNFLESLLQKQPKKRLGSASIQQIKRHEYFTGISWGKLMKRQIPAPKRVLLQQSSDNQNQQQIIGMFHSDIDYNEQNYRINRFRNFSFVREEEFFS